MYIKGLGVFLTVKVLENTSAVLSLGKVCDENGYSYEWINGQKPHLIHKTGLGFHATRRTSFPLWFQACQRVRPLDLNQLQRHLQDRSFKHNNLLPARLHLTVRENKTRERGDRIESDISPVHVSTTFDDRSGRPDDCQANEKPKTNLKGNHDRTERPVVFRDPSVTAMKFQYTGTHTPVLLTKRL